MIPSFDDMFVQIQNKILEFYPESKLDYRHFKRENFYEIRYYDKDLVDNQAFQKFIYEECSNCLYDKGMTNYCINYRTKKIVHRKLKINDDRINNLTQEFKKPITESCETIEILKSQYDYLCEQVEFIDNILHKLAHEFEPKIKQLIHTEGDTSKLIAEITQIYDKVCLLVSPENPKRKTFDNLYNRYVYNIIVED